MKAVEGRKSGRKCVAVDENLSEHGNVPSRPLNVVSIILFESRATNGMLRRVENYLARKARNLVFEECDF